MGVHHQTETYRFCPVCGSKITPFRPWEPQASKSICPECGHTWYLDPKVVACSVLEWDDTIVLLKRGINPEKGKWVMPGGFVDRGEAVPDAALRETLEECGVQSRIHGLLGVYSYTGRIPVVVVYIARYVTGRFEALHETLEAQRFSITGIPWENLAFQSTVDALKDYVRLRSS